MTVGDLFLKRADFFTDETGTHPIRGGEGYSGSKAGDPKPKADGAKEKRHAEAVKKWGPKFAASYTDKEIAAANDAIAHPDKAGNMNLKEARNIQLGRNIHTRDSYTDVYNNSGPKPEVNGREGVKDTPENYHAAREHAQALADKHGVYVRLSKTTEYGTKKLVWNMVPHPTKQFGRDLQGELITPRGQPERGDFPMGQDKGTGKAVTGTPRI